MNIQNERKTKKIIVVLILEPDEYKKLPIFLCYYLREHLWNHSDYE